MHLRKRVRVDDDRPLGQAALRTGRRRCGHDSGRIRDRSLDVYGAVGRPDHPGGVGQPAGEVRRKRLEAADRFALHPELFGL